MKTNELIKILKEIDPDGNSECVINNMSIRHVQMLPYYYDGDAKFVELDSYGDPIKITNKSSNTKVKLSQWDLEEIAILCSEFDKPLPSIDIRDRIEKEIIEKNMKHVYNISKNARIETQKGRIKFNLQQTLEELKTLNYACQLFERPILRNSNNSNSLIENITNDIANQIVKIENKISEYVIINQKDIIKLFENEFKKYYTSRNVKDLSPFFDDIAYDKNAYGSLMKKWLTDKSYEFADWILNEWIYSTLFPTENTTNHNK
jgi:hypothetical protein